MGNLEEIIKECEEEATISYSYLVKAKNGLIQKGWIKG